MAKHRKSHRRRHTKRARKTHRRMRGGSPANYGSNNLGGLDLPQGRQYTEMHIGQHGGAAPIASIGESFLNGQEAVVARTAALDEMLAQTAGMKDQNGGRRRRRRGRKGASRRRSRKMHGGSYVETPAEVTWREAVKVPEGANPQFASWDAAR